MYKTSSCVKFALWRARQGTVKSHKLFIVVKSFDHAFESFSLSLKYSTDHHEIRTFLSESAPLFSPATPENA